MLNIIKLLFQLLPLAFYAHRDFFKLRMPDNDCVIVACGNPAAELLAVSCFKILLCCHKYICTRIEPQILGSPLTDKMIWHNKHGFLA